MLGASLEETLWPSEDY